MFERFFKDAFGPDSDAAGIMQFGFQPSKIKEDAEFDVTRGKEILVEKIDLGDSLLVIIEGYSGIDGITIEVIEKKVVVDNGLNKKFVDIPILADVEKSGYSFRNGILEIRLQKISDEIKTAVKSAGILQIDH
jgi:hypothetical protein